MSGAAFNDRMDEEFVGVESDTPNVGCQNRLGRRKISRPPEGASRVSRDPDATKERRGRAGTRSSDIRIASDAAPVCAPGTPLEAIASVSRLTGTEQGGTDQPRSIAP